VLFATRQQTTSFEQHSRTALRAGIAKLGNIRECPPSIRKSRLLHCLPKLVLSRLEELCHSLGDRFANRQLGRVRDRAAPRRLGESRSRYREDRRVRAQSFAVRDAARRRRGDRQGGAAELGPGKFDAELSLDGKAFNPQQVSHGVVTGTSVPGATLLPNAYGLAGFNQHTWTGA
jgi:hypothetical protein